MAVPHGLCPYCRSPRHASMVTCGDSYCQEANYHDVMSRSGRKVKRNAHRIMLAYVLGRIDAHQNNRRGTA